MRPDAVGSRSSRNQVVDEVMQTLAAPYRQLIQIHQQQTHIDPITCLDPVRLSHLRGLSFEESLDCCSVIGTEAAYEVKQIEQNIGAFNTCGVPTILIDIISMLVLYSFAH